MTRRRLMIGAIAGLLVAGCAGTSQYYHVEVPAGTPSATVHLVRANNFTGAAIAAPVFINGMQIGDIGPGGHLKSYVPVGKALVSSTGSPASFVVEAGKIYYIEIGYSLQMWLWRPVFTATQIDAARAADIAGRKL
ncbi:hypothetical protein [Azoarcus sp. DN11]|uniref:hypothetical protein n=1 Tax=Azoarcus sp. DN11 TaxID=356837 RepID=UPI000EAC43A5|nr:hypothetical protein [Azoarcus sp. DN11]AYH43338.1 hypothetical protein CDA09_08080 [Azoarcus sp. DN11]